MHTYLRTYCTYILYTYIHKYICSYICTYIHTHILTYIHTHIHSYIHSGVNYGGSESGAGEEGGGGGRGGGGGGGRGGGGGKCARCDFSYCRRFLVIVVIKDPRLGRGVYSGNLEQSLPSSPHLSQLPVPVRYSFFPPSPLHPAWLQAFTNFGSSPFLPSPPPTSKLTINAPVVYMAGDISPSTRYPVIFMYMSFCILYSVFFILYSVLYALSFMCMSFAAALKVLAWVRGEGERDKVNSLCPAKGEGWWAGRSELTLTPPPPYLYECLHSCSKTVWGEMGRPPPQPIQEQFRNQQRYEKCIRYASGT